jgi:hypothetical protein
MNAPKTSEPLKVPKLKPRNKHLHEVLLSRAGGPMRNKKNKPRSKNKQELRQTGTED